jgi:hypothetical protein
VIFTIQVEGNSAPIHLKPPVDVLSTCTVLVGLILISTLGSRGRLTRPATTNSPRDMVAVVIKISAWAFPLNVTRQAVEATAVPISFVRIASLPCRL